MEEKKGRMKTMQEAFAIHRQNVEPIIVDGAFVCYVHGSHYEDYFATYRRNPNEIVKEFLLSKGKTVEEGFAVLLKECGNSRRVLSFQITHYLDLYQKRMDYDEALLIKIHEMRQTPQYQAYIEGIKEKFPLSEYSCM